MHARFSMMLIVATFSLGSLVFGQTGDFNGDGQYDCQDIDALSFAVADGLHPPQFDLTGDGQVLRSDITAWLTEAGNINVGAPYLMGDTDLSGGVDASDFGGAWDANRFTSGNGWCHADMNADQIVDVSDALIILANIFQDSGTVPGVGVGTEIVQSNEGRFVYDPNTGSMYTNFQSPMAGFVIPGPAADEVFYEGLEQVVTGAIWLSVHFAGDQQFFGVLAGGFGMNGAHLVATYPQGLTANDFGIAEYGASRLDNDLAGVLGNEVEVRTVLPGDANLDGYVDVLDFNLWNQNKFTNFAAWVTGDFNG